MNSAISKKATVFGSSLGSDRVRAGGRPKNFGRPAFRPFAERLAEISFGHGQLFGHFGLFGLFGLSSLSGRPWPGWVLGNGEVESRGS